jgi:hypothetical protein
MGFLILTFWGAFCHQGKFAFWNSTQNPRFFDTPYDLSQEKKIHHSEKRFSNFLTQKLKKR